MVRGRPRNFEETRVVEAAMLAFWQRGYQATTFEDLTDAMQLNRPSVYAAFGDKSKLFRRCVSHYVKTHVRPNEVLLDSKPHWIDAMEAYLLSWAKLFADRKAPGGCFLASHLGDESVDVEIKADLQRLAKSRLSVVVKRLARARDENQLSIDTNVPALANVVLCFLAGMSAMARTGASPQQFSSAIATFMQLLRSISKNH